MSQSSTYMSFHVSFKVSTLRESFAAFLAFIWFFSCMSANMNLECAWSHESLITIRTFEGPFSWMTTHVISQMPLSREGFATTFYLTGKWLLSWVNSQVSLQVSFLSKGLPATWNIALERLFTSLKKLVNLMRYMCSNVYLESSWTRITFSTNFTDERFVSWMNELMCFQMSLGYELFLTTVKTANKRPFSCLYSAKLVI